MIPDVLIVREKAGIAATTGFTGAAPQQVSGNAIDMREVQPGTLSVCTTVKGDTNTITLTGKWQVQLKDGATWVDVASDANNPANVALATGTAGADAAVQKVIPAPLAVHAYRKARFVVVSGVAVGAGAGTDEVSQLVYSFIKPSF